MDTARAFYTKSGHFFFDIQNKVGEASPHLVARLKLHFKFFYSVQIKTTHKPWKEVAAKKILI